MQQAIADGIIDISRVQATIEMKRKEKIISQHNYSIWEGKNGNWYTYVYDETKEKNRRLVKRKSRRSIEDYIVKNYKAKNIENQITIKSLFKEWLEYKSLKVNSANTINRLLNDWSRFYDNEEYNRIHQTDIIHTPIQDLSKIQLEKWAHHMVRFGNIIPFNDGRIPKKDRLPNLSTKQYYNMTLIVREILDYAVDQEILDVNLYRKVKVNNKLFRKVEKPKDETQVFLKDEVPKIIELAWQDFEKNPSDVTILSIILNFYLGARVGELVALKREDIVQDKYVHIHHQFVKDFNMDDVMHPVFIGYKDVNYTKSDAGDREVYLVSEATSILNTIYETLDKYHSHLEDYQKGYLFVKDGKVMSQNRVGQLLGKYCRELGIIKKSNHKIRKTFISTLFDSGMNLNTIRSMVGHEDERTTLHNYTFNRCGNAEIEKQLEESLSMQRPKENNQYDENKVVLQKKSFKVITGNHRKHVRSNKKMA